MIRSISAGLTGTAVTNWKTHLDALVDETLALTKGIQAETLLSPIAREPILPPAIRPTGKLREEIAQRVAQFRAHQQHLIRERENYAQGQVTRMQDLLAASGIKRLQTRPR